MQTDSFLVHLRHIPDYLSAQWNAHMGICIIIAVVYLIALFLAGNSGRFLRKILTVLLIIYVSYGIILNSSRFGYQIVLIGLIALIFMGFTRAIINMIFESRMEQIEAQIEREALAKAESRRGKFRSSASEFIESPKESNHESRHYPLSDYEDSIENQIKAARAEVNRSRNEGSAENDTSENQ